MKQHQAIERRGAQHYAHPQLETGILAALAVEGKNVDDAAAAGSVFTSTASWRLST
jgi:hypothetical protein